MSPLSRLLPPASAPAARFSAICYVLHLLCQGWIASSEVFLGLAICGIMFAIARKEVTVRFHPLYFALALFLIGSTISAFASFRPAFALSQIGEWFTFLSFPTALTLYRCYPDFQRTGRNALIALAVFLSSYGIYQYFVLGQRDLEHRITGTTAHVMTFSGIILPLSLFFAVLMIGERWPLAGLAAALSTFALVLTFTRGAWLGWLAAFFGVIISRRPRWFAYAVPILILLIALSPMSLFARLASVFDTRQSSNLDRIRMIEAGVEMIWDRPLLGVGPSNVKEIYPLYRLSDAPRFRIPHLHNNVVQIWAERGFLGLIGYVLIVGLFVVECFRALKTPTSRTLGTAGIAVAVSLAFAGLFEFNFGDTEVLLTMLDLFALTIAAIELAAPEVSLTDPSPVIASDAV